MKRWILIALLLFGAGFGIRAWLLADRPVEAEVLEVAEIAAPVETTERYTITDEDVFTSAAEALGINYADALQIVDAASEVFDFTRVRVGKDLQLVSVDGVPDRLVYEPNSEETVIVDLRNGYKTRVDATEYEIRLAQARGVIDGSLYVSALKADIPEMAILEYAEVFAWEVDFATQVQNGDRYAMVYEERYRDGELVGVGEVVAASFTNGGETSRAYRYTDQNGEIGYYDEEGASLIRPFLKAPLSFTRVTSGYTMARFHPVTGQTTPHRAIDYGAPTGTPIMAVGDGTVTVARYNGGFGNYIDIRHNEKYETQYAHLSRYAVSVGDRVTQGQIIGYVGNTGWSTGPHLHYQVRVNGTLVNPLEVEFPKGETLTAEQLPEFEKQRKQYERFLEQ